MNLKWKHLIIIILFVSNFTDLVSQSSVRNLDSNKKNVKLKGKKSAYKSKYHLKVYYNFLHTNNDYESYSEAGNHIVDFDHRESNFGRVSAAFVIKNKRSFHEIELARINYDKKEEKAILIELDDGTSQMTSGFIAYLFNLNLKYEFNYQIINLKNKVMLFTAISAEPYIEFSKFEPKVSFIYKTKDHIYGCKTYIIPRLTYDFSKRWYLDLNFPIEFADLYFIRSKIENPTLPLELQATSNSDVKYFDQGFQFRIGIGLKI
jgi:hypothetical protein